MRKSLLDQIDLGFVCDFGRKGEEGFEKIERSSGRNR